VSRADDGVTLFLNMTAGDWLKACSSKEKSACGVGGLVGTPGMVGAMDNLLSLRASVGLMVLAPRPLTWCMVDWRLLEDDEGVCEPPAGRPGERAWVIGLAVCSEPMDALNAVFSMLGGIFGGAWNDLAFADRAALDPLEASGAMIAFAGNVPRRLPCPNEGVRPMRACGLSLDSLGTSCRVSRLGVGSMPGPTDLRGARAAGFGGAWAGNWLCRRVRMDMLVAGGGMEGLSGGPETALFLDWLKRRSRDVLRAGRESAAGAGGAFIDAAGPVGLTGFCDGGREAMCGAGGGSEDESGGLGKLLRTGSYARLLAKSSNVTSGMKLKCSPASTGMLGGACLLKLKREAAKFVSLMEGGKARFCDAMLASLVTL
jgi:hypothetical protein